MARSSGIRGSRIGAGPMGESERGNSVERIVVTFWCADGHSTRPVFAATAAVPEVWDCHGCGRPAGLDPDDPPGAALVAPFKTHLAYVRERRSDADAEILLAEALTKLRNTR
ncbi:MAG: RNA polymerase-binding protein RbpA [Catenulispora sp.]|nr:RNA polymerase-binding protein RbpA [Catenulispora sp.]NUR61433.1 RNA polymerase-binding protein RbpA [Catenulispora sp.]